MLLVTDESVLETAVEAIRRGAYDTIAKTPEYLSAIPLVVEKNLAIWRTKQDSQHLASRLTRALKQLRFKNRQIERMVSELHRTAAMDPLTSLANRRAIGRMFAECHRHQRDLACIMIDLDGFKQLNDTLGHQRGDEFLQCTAGILHRYCRQSDTAGRFGCDEFIVLLPETDLATMAHSRPSSHEQLMAHADQALYRAKQAGKTCVMVCQDDPTSHPASSPGPGTRRKSAAPRQRASLSAR